MAIITAKDIIDELIKPIVEETPAFIENTDAFLENLVQSFDSTKTLSNIPSPAPYKVKQIAIAKCCYDVCVAKFGGQVGVYFKGQEGQDRWYTKLKFYQKELEKLESEMTLELLTGESAEGKSFTSVPIGRC